MLDMGAEPTTGRCEAPAPRSEEHTSELQSRLHLVCRLLLEKKKIRHIAVPAFPIRSFGTLDDPIHRSFHTKLRMGALSITLCSTALQLSLQRLSRGLAYH